VILGLYPLQGGAILADGRDIRQLDPGEWRHAISYVPKHCHLFNGTIAQNIALSHPTATILDITAAAEDAGLLHFEFEEFMPDGLETNLSRQRIYAMPEDLKQRIVLARAFAKPAPFYLFDSPVQNLSASGIACVVSKVNTLRGKSTVIMLTERRELIEAADRVLYVSNGQVTWDGSPKAFLAKQLKAA
jgi:ATP-binding cassette subfamily C protein LapB